MNPRVCIETTIISYLTARRSAQLVMAAHQEATRKWWDDDRPHFDLFVSELVIQEASAGDAEAAQKRLDVTREFPELKITDEARDLAGMVIAKGQLPAKAPGDALHIATATVNGMDYLLTWNCRHIANATLRMSMRRISEGAGYVLPVLCTPLELTEVPRDD